MRAFPITTRKPLICFLICLPLMMPPSDGLAAKTKLEKIDIMALVHESIAVLTLHR